jgi:hypothetical protein
VHGAVNVHAERPSEALLVKEKEFALAAYILMRAQSDPEVTVRIRKMSRIADSKRDFLFLFEDPDGQIPSLKCEWLHSESRVYDRVCVDLRKILFPRDDRARRSGRR